VRKPWDFEEPVCAEVGTEIFFLPDLDERDRYPLKQGNYREAKKLCQQCPHLVECAEWGIYNEEHGMWGGMTPVERSQMRRKLGIVVAPRVMTIR